MACDVLPVVMFYDDYHNKDGNDDYYDNDEDTDNDVTVIQARPTLGATLVVGSRNGKAGQDCQVEEKTLMHQYPYQS